MHKRWFWLLLAFFNLSAAYTHSSPISTSAKNLEIRIHSSGANLSQKDFITHRKIKNGNNKLFLIKESRFCHLFPIINPIELKCMGIKSTFEQNDENLILNLYFEWSHGVARERQAIAAIYLFYQLVNKDIFISRILKQLEGKFSEQSKLAQGLLSKDQYNYSFSAFSHFGNVVLMLHELNADKQTKDIFLKNTLEVVNQSKIAAPKSLDGKISHAIFFGTPILPETEAILARDDLEDTFPLLIFCSSKTDRVQTSDRISSNHKKNYLVGSRRFPNLFLREKENIFGVQIQAFDNNQQLKIDHIRMYTSEEESPLFPIAQFRDKIKEEICAKQQDLLISLHNEHNKNIELETEALPPEKMSSWKKAAAVLIPAGIGFSIYKLCN